MSKKLGMSGDGKKIISIFIGVIMAIVLLGVAANQLFVSSNTVSESNVSITAGATNASLSIPGRNIIGSYTVWNGSSLLSSGGNITLQDETISGAQTVTMIVHQNGSSYASTVVNVTYSYEPDGYVRESGARAMMTLILIAGALAIVVFIVLGLYNKGPLSKLIGKGE